MRYNNRILCYLLVAIAASVSGCDELYWDSSLYDLYGKEDGTLNWCGTYDSEGKIVKKGDVVRLVKLKDDMRYEYTCADLDKNERCTGVNVKICNIGDINTPCAEYSAVDYKLSKEEKLYKTSFHNNACPTSFTCRNISKQDTIDNAGNSSAPTDGSENQLLVDKFECIIATCADTAVDLRSKDTCGGCKIDCTDEDQTCDDGRCVRIQRCEQDKLTCRCSGSVTDGTFKCTTPSKDESIPKEELVCIDSTSDQMCGIATCEEYDGKEVCPADKSCKTDSGVSQCVCSQGTFPIKDGSCANPKSQEHCGIDVSHPEGVACTKGHICDGTNCVCATPFYQCGISPDQSNCVDLSSNPENCGFCGNNCLSQSANSECMNYQCVCPNDGIICNGRCINPKKDSSYCGATGSCNGDKAGVKCGSNQVCKDGNCTCISDAYFTVNYKDENGLTKSKCINMKTTGEDRYVLYCGSNQNNPDVHQNCEDIPNSKCGASGIGKAECQCDGLYIPHYDKSITDFNKLIKCIPINGDAHMCEYDPNTQDYVDCYKSCDGKDDEHCNKSFSNDKAWDCINNKCEPKCGLNKVECRNRWYDPINGEFKQSDEFVCLSDNLVNKDKPYDDSFDEKEKICKCLACPSTNPDEICLPINNPIDKGTNPSATFPHSLNHCSECYDSCPQMNYTRCIEDVSIHDRPYICSCLEDERRVTYNGKEYCLPKDYSTYNFVCNNNNGKTVCTCAQGYLDIDNDFSNGCEQSMANDPNQCGKGGTDTNYSNCNDNLDKYHTNIAICSAGTCLYQSCQDGYGDCNNKLNDGCENDLSSNDHCGACNQKCDLDCWLYQCTNKCTNKSGESNRYTCCVEGEVSKKYKLDQIQCCEGHKLYRYKHSALNPLCIFSDHYACFDKAPKDTKCWSEVK